MHPAPRLTVSLLLLSSGLCAADLQPFPMPWNDASPGITNLQSWQSIPAGDEGRVNITPDGHYQVNARPIRFFGVNPVDKDCFPTHAQAEAHAARLARFGFNCARLHHMEAPWERDKVLVDYASGTSRKLSAERLERLQYFVAQLAARGIYSNINLLVSREFQPSDGLGAEISQITDYKVQHILGFFLDAALDLHCEYATQLLTAPNPYRGGLSFAEDPAVAFVEIMNENGLLQKWYGNALDALPAPYAQALQARWNAWLKTKYATTAQLLAAWGKAQPVGPNRLVNGDFAGGTGSWILEQNSGAAATTAAAPDFTGGLPSLRIAVTTAGASTWHVQLTQGGLSLVAGQTYTLSFWAKADAATPVSATLTRTGPSDYTAVRPSLGGTVDTTWQQFTTTFQAEASEPSVRLVFGGFGDRLARVWIADVRFQQGGAIGSLPDGASLEAATIPIVAHRTLTDNTTIEQVRDWIGYVQHAERTYWNAMAAHIKGTIGYDGIVFGTIVGNSPPNAQAGLDAMDSHAYWHIVQFPPGVGWDPENWFVPNESMVNSPGSCTIANAARERVVGYPHNVTEYNHSSPNTYSSEAPLFAAAYGALQDWDGIWMFEYETGADEHVTGDLDFGRHAGKMVNSLIAAALFRRGDVTVANQGYMMSFPPEREIEAARTKGWDWSIASGAEIGVPATLALQSRLTLAVGENPPGLINPPPAPSGPVYTSDTGQLRWDTSVSDKGVVTINTPRTKAMVGFVNGRSFTIGDVVIAPGTTRQDWCTIGLTLMEGQSFATAGAARGLIAATGDQENTGQIWKDSSKNSVGTNWGRAPVLVEVIPASITLPVAASRVSVWALDAKGQRQTAVAVRDSGGKAQFNLGQSGTTLWYEFAIAASGPVAPAVAQHPATVSAVTGATATLRVAAEGNPAPAVQWIRNGTAVTGATSATLALADLQPVQTGLYRATLTNASGERTSDYAILGLTTASKVVGAGREVGSNIFVASNGNTFDQVLLEGAAATVTADHALNQITRISFVDLDDDIVQLEMSGPGTLSLVLDSPSGPALPVNYNQSVTYMRGHAGIVITGADERTNVSIFSVGRATAVNQGLFKSDVAYDGLADVAFIAIASTNGKFGGMRAANANFFAAKGLTGVYAPGVTFFGPVYVGDIVASADATPVLRLGSASNTRITGGDLLQDNGAAVQISGITQLVFAAGSDSHGNSLPAQRNRAVLTQGGVDVTAQVAVNP